MTMTVGMVGLGRMGGNMARRLLRRGHAVVGYDLDRERVGALVDAGARGAATLEELARLDPPRVIWLMLPQGPPTEDTFDRLLPRLERDDILLDGANARYPDSIRRAGRAAARGVHFLDVGVSGGIWGLEAGYCLMVGGAREAFSRVEPLFRALAPEAGYAHVGPSGSGHFVKMVHNAIEYGMLQAYAEGFELLRARAELGLDLAQIAALWQQGSVIRSWLLELAARALAREPDLASVRGWVEDSGEGRWAVIEAVESAVPLPAIAGALFARFRSRQDEGFAAKVIAALRGEFGGHAVRREAGGTDPGAGGGAA